MRAWAKRMIWFFGTYTLFTIEETILPSSGDINAQGVIALIKIGTIVTPLFFMEDDPEPQQR